MDLQTVKLLAGIPVENTKHDSFLQAKVPILLDWARDYCNKTFMVGDVEVLPAGVKKFVGEAIKYDLRDKGLKSRQLGNVTYTFDTDYPDSVTRNLAPYRALRW
jgi:Phage gp6-like head-tail connector protein